MYENSTLLITTHIRSEETASFPERDCAVIGMRLPVLTSASTIRDHATQHSGCYMHQTALFIHRSRILAVGLILRLLTLLGQPPSIQSGLPLNLTFPTSPFPELSSSLQVHSNRLLVYDKED
jgi:hypothetical protein